MPGTLLSATFPPQLAWAFTGSSPAGDVAALVLALAVVLAAAKLAGDLATRLGQPAVLGELVVGIALGNLRLLGWSGLEFVKESPSVGMLAELGVLVLLFEVGLESTVGDMLEVGLSSFLVAALGVVTPMALGWGVGAWLLPAAGPYVHAFLGATLCATSVGITARVLQDLGRSRTPEARIILGAAVIDDVLGLIVLAVVSGVIAAADRGAELRWGAVTWIVAKAALFLCGAIVLGRAASPRLFRWASRLRGRGVLLASGLAFCFFLSWASAAIGLAPIVGAFAAGLVLEDVHTRDFVDRGEHGLEELVAPISSFLVPVFFVLMGMRTDLSSLARPGVLLLAAGLTAAAILGKQACSLGVVGSGVNRLAVGLGMIPRGEVGLIFANMGLALTLGGHPVLDQAAYAAIVIVVLVTTLVTPPALRFGMGHSFDVRSAGPRIGERP